MALSECNFVDKAVDDLLGKGCVKLVHSTPHVCSPLMVVESSSGKKRLIIDLKYLNLYLWKDKFKYKDIRTALTYCEKNNFMVTFDLKLGYHHVDIHKSSKTYLGFQWNANYYVFTVLPFGLSTACYVFRPIVKFVHSQGIRIASGFVEATRISALIKELLSSAGLILNQEKSNLLPAQKGRWLGYDIDLQVGSICVPERKIVVLKTQLASVIKIFYLQRLLLGRLFGFR